MRVQILAQPGARNTFNSANEMMMHLFAQTISNQYRRPLPQLPLITTEILYQEINLTYHRYIYLDHQT